MIKMGLKHLMRMEKLFKSEDRYFSKTEFRDELRTDMSIIEEVLEYMLASGVVRKKKIGDRIKYKWVG
jgi:hypothetical protein